jgi:hypothetical protein
MKAEKPVLTSELIRARASGFVRSQLATSGQLQLLLTARNKINWHLLPPPPLVLSVHVRKSRFQQVGRKSFLLRYYHIEQKSALVVNRLKQFTGYSGLPEKNSDIFANMKQKPRSFCYVIQALLREDPWNKPRWKIRSIGLLVLFR